MHEYVLSVLRVPFNGDEFNGLTLTLCRCRSWLKLWPIYLNSCGAVLCLWSCDLLLLHHYPLQAAFYLGYVFVCDLIPVLVGIFTPKK